MLQRINEIIREQHLLMKARPNPLYRIARTTTPCTEIVHGAINFKS